MNTMKANLAMALAMHKTRDDRRLRVGLLDLDIFGPSSPKLMGLDKAEEPSLTESASRIGVSLRSATHRNLLRSWSSHSPP